MPTSSPPDVVIEAVSVGIQVYYGFPQALDLLMGVIVFSDVLQTGIYMGLANQRDLGKYGDAVSDGINSAA